MHFSTILTALAATVAAAPAADMTSRDIADARRERFLARHHERAEQGNATVGQGHSHPNQHVSVGPKVNILTAMGNQTYQTDYSSNWCGAVQTSPPQGQTFTTLQATWQMPTLERPPGASGSGTWYGSQWVGIDGYTYGGAILQAGTTSAVTYNSDGSSYNSASSWFEWYPNPETEMQSFGVNPGDTIFTIVTAYSSTSGNVYMKNQNSGQEISQNFNAPSNNNALEGVNAEWIYEDFSSGGLVPFAQFSDTRMSGCNAGTSNGGVNLAGSTIVDMVANGNVVCNANIVDATDLVFKYGS